MEWIWGISGDRKRKLWTINSRHTQPFTLIPRACPPSHPPSRLQPRLSLTPAHTLSHTPLRSQVGVCLCPPSMAPRMAALLALSLLVLCISPALGGANDAEDCCLSVTQRAIPGHLVRAFRYLLVKDGCRLPAVVFTTMRGHQLCAPPDQPWVTRIIRRLQRNPAKNKRQSN
ncbi:C-C motif chemokine 19 [Erinaceus europaeus]|uniref:C-C motif chemokine n=1 Tax=Erinaceus europaeus TaxID=9365 RepID=A0ABM3Y1G7_ERIEU|nr:C-C motif chemokine 19 [Erinaceus europaeus]